LALSRRATVGSFTLTTFRTIRTARALGCGVI